MKSSRGTVAELNRGRYGQCDKLPLVFFYNNNDSYFAVANYEATDMTATAMGKPPPAQFLLNR